MLKQLYIRVEDSVLEVLARFGSSEKHEDYALEKLLELYMQTQKQVFIAIDKAGSYTEHTKEILESTKILQLGVSIHVLF